MDSNFTGGSCLRAPHPSCPDTYEHTPAPVVGQLITLEEDIPASLYTEEDVTGVVRRAQGVRHLHRSPPPIAGDINTTSCRATLLVRGSTWARVGEMAWRELPGGLEGKDVSIQVGGLTVNCMVEERVSHSNLLSRG